MYCCKWEIYSWLFIALFVVLSSCDEAKSEEFSLYFDSKNYIEQEVEDLLDHVEFVQKTLILNGEKEVLDSVQADSTSFEELEELFAEANINKGIFKGEYQVDTFWIVDEQEKEQIEVLDYQTSNPELKVQWVQVYSNGSLKATLQENNFLFSYEKEVFYEKAKSFSVISWQKTIGQDTIKVFSEVKIM